ncbi:hypothetical protein PsYK624_160900 [Phanerochaete sordida]|uniref:Uncharacterized protein n=1 Tax=Phanerochaete sordida TaxID=48140 RepID=A0A9P3GRM9_9APHY|nr:hypothetical protein PsYK624_160900 [Phanerochaete sordida]
MMNTPDLFRFLANVLRDPGQMSMLGMHMSADGALFSTDQPENSDNLCLVRGFVFGDSDWHPAHVLGSRQVKLANHLYTKAYTCLYAREPDVHAQADFLPYFGEVWWPSLPEPRIAQPNVSFHNIVLHRIVFVPIISLYTPAHPRKGKAPEPILAPVWFPALLEDSPTDEHPFYTVRVFGTSKTLSAPVSTQVILESQRAGSIRAPHINALSLRRGTVLEAPVIRHIAPFALAWSRAAPVCDIAAGTGDDMWMHVLTFEGRRRWKWSQFLEE